MMIQRFLSTGLLMGAVASVLSVAVDPSWAQTTGGFNVLGGVEAEYRLSSIIQNNERRDPRARYLLEVRSDKVSQAVSQLRITYPDAFTDYRGRFNVDTIEVRRGLDGRGTSIPVDEVVWTEESNTLDIYLQEDIPADTSFTIVLNNVRNPNRSLMQRFNLEAFYRGDVLPTYIGTWELLVAYGDNL
jgi:Protein of unknown function (DUF2808)